MADKTDKLTVMPLASQPLAHSKRVARQVLQQAEPRLRLNSYSVSQPLLYC